MGTPLVISVHAERQAALYFPVKAAHPSVDADDRPRDAAENCRQQDHVFPPGVLKIAGLGS
jgi:hypothetical protein